MFAIVVVTVAIRRCTCGERGCSGVEPRGGSAAVVSTVVVVVGPNMTCEKSNEKEKKWPRETSFMDENGHTNDIHPAGGVVVVAVVVVLGRQRRPASVVHP